MTVFDLSWLDYRLNPVLRKACKADIPKFCQNILNRAKDDTELEGQVISCLKLKYADQVSSAEAVLGCAEQLPLNNKSNCTQCLQYTEMGFYAPAQQVGSAQVKMQGDWFMRKKVIEWVNDFLRSIASLSRLRGPNSSDHPGISSWLSTGSPASDALLWRGRRSSSAVPYSGWEPHSCLMKSLLNQYWERNTAFFFSFLSCQA